MSGFDLTEDTKDGFDHTVDVGGATPTLTPAQWQRVDELFELVSGKVGVERGAFLESICDDPAVRAEVLSLLRCAPAAGDVVQAAVGNAAERFTAIGDSMVGRRLGPYRVVALLGEGGMGAVYLAERDDAEFRREVAIKVLRNGLGSPEAIARFRDERQILADLEHPGIVRLLDGGTHDGVPYLVMEQIAGVPITQYARERGLSVRERVALLRRVCDALGYAHAKHVVHRDIKPSNLLVGSDGQPKLLDFGIAKLVGADDYREARTRTGVALLTPEYASPEQARGEPVTIATDIYSLGAVAYELFAGRPPIQASGSPLQIMRSICEVEPPRPSSIAAANSRAISGDLDNIVLKALNKNPAHRYAAVAALSEDLGRHLDGRPVAAHSARWMVRTGKRLSHFRAWRRRSAFAFGLLLALLVVGGVWFALRRDAATTPPSAAERLATVWSDSRRLEIQARFAETPGPDIPGTWRSVDDVLQTYARRWSELWNDAIQSPDRDGDALLYGQRIACLENGFIALQGAIDSVENAEISSFARTYPGHFELPFPEDCVATSVLRAQIPAPPPHLREEIARLQLQIQAATQLVRRWQVSHDRDGVPITLATDDFERGLRMFADAATRLDALSSPVAAQAWGLRADYLTTRAAYDSTFRIRARAAIEHAISRAESYRHEQWLVLILAMRLHLESAAEGDRALIDPTVQQGRRALERAGNPIYVGHVFAMEWAQAELARRHFTEAIQVLDEDQKRTASVADPLLLHGVGSYAPYGHRVNALLGLGRFDDAVREHERWLAFSIDRLGADHVGTVMTRAGLALTLNKAGRTAEALDQITEATRRLEGLNANGPLIDALVRQLDYALRLGRTDRAEEAFGGLRARLDPLTLIQTIVGLQAE